MERGSASSGMIHYYVWFSFQPEVQPDEGLQRVRTFLDEMTRRGVVQEFRLLRNRSAADKTREFQVVGSSRSTARCA